MCVRPSQTKSSQSVWAHHLDIAARGCEVGSDSSYTVHYYYYCCVVSSDEAGAGVGLCLKADVAQYARELPGWNRDAVVFVCAISAGQNARTLRSPEGIIATAADNAFGARDMSASDLQLTNQWPGLEKFNLVQDYLEKNK